MVTLLSTTSLIIIFDTSCVWIRVRCFREVFIYETIAALVNDIRFGIWLLWMAGANSTGNGSFFKWCGA